MQKSSEDLISLLIEIKNQLQCYGSKYDILIDRINEQIEYHYQVIQKSLIMIPQQQSTNAIFFKSTSDTFHSSSISLNDFFILELNYDKSQYQIYGYNANLSKKIKDIRYGIKDLIISNIKHHIRPKQRTKSMTDLHKLTSNPPPNKQPIIMPYLLQNKKRYTYIFETQQCINVNGTYYTYDRYYCFVAPILAKNSISNILRKVKNKIFQNRVVWLQSVQDVDYIRVKNTFEKNFKNLKYIIKKDIELLDQNPFDSNFTLTKLLISQRNGEQQYPLKVNTLVTLFYFVIKQFKIILVETKECKEEISKYILQLLQCLNPLQYIFPIVQMCYTKSHCDLLESPTPMIVGLWQTSKNYQHLLRHLLNVQKTMNEDGLDQVILDLNHLKIIGKMNNSQDFYILQNLDKYLKQKLQKSLKTQENLPRLLHKFIKHKLFEDSKPNQPQWLKLLQKQFRSSHLFQNHQEVRTKSSILQQSYSSQIY